MAELIIDATTGTITGTVGLTLNPGVAQSVTIGGEPILGGNHYPTTTGGSTEFLKSNGDGTISWAEVSHPEMTGATSGSNGIAGIVPAPNAGDQAKFLRGDATWATIDTSNFLIKSNNLSDLTNVTTAGANLGLTIGTSAGNVIVLDGSAKLPAVDGSQLTNISGGGGSVDSNTLALYSMIFGG